MRQRSVTRRDGTGAATPGPRTRTVAMVGAAAAVVAGVAVGLAPTSQAASTATVTVNASASRGSVPAAGLGLNEAIWDGRMNDADQSALLTAAGVRALRYPGGSYGDIYHWKTNTADGGYVAPNTSFDQFMTTAKAVGAQPVLIANYGSGTAQEAADWVTYANVTKKYGVKYWEIGNEVYGNGHYGSGWETDKHADKSPKAYAANVLQYISAMKAVDPTVKVGVVLTTPGSWPDGVVGSGDGADWNNTVMSIVGGKADFVIVHWYPNATSPADSLGKVGAQIPTITSALRSLITKYAGSNAANVGIAVTEGNPGYQDDSATAGLFAADSFFTWWENGVFTWDWWNLRNGGNGSVGTNGDGTPDYNDQGIVSSGSTGEPAANTPFPPYYGLSLVGRAASPGDTLITATSNNPLLTAHAVRTGSGAVKVVLINKDLTNSTAVSLSYAGISPNGSVTVQQWQKGATGITSTTQSGAGAITVPAYSITVLSSGGGGATPAPSSSTTAPAPAPTATPVPTTPVPTTPAPTTPGTAPFPAPTATTPGATPPAAEARTGRLRSASAQRCLRPNGTTSGAAVVIAGCNDSAAQRWTLTAGGALTVFGTKCLSAGTGTVVRGTQVRITDCTGAADQLWTVRSNGTLANPATGLCLDVFRRRTAAGTPVDVWTCTAATNQQWSWR